MAINKVLLLDTETNGLDPSVNKCLEVAVSVYSIPHRAVVDSFSSLMYATSNETEHINQIPLALLLEAPPAEIVWGRVFQRAERCDVIIAHRAEFDRGFSPPELQDLNWVCSKFDIVNWPKSSKIGDHLINLCLSHGVGVVHAHRAATDVDLLARLFTRVAELGADVQEMLVLAMRPKKRFVASVSFEEKDKAKDCGFGWNPDRRQWYRMMVPEEADKLPFQVRQID